MSIDPELLFQGKVVHTLDQLVSAFRDLAALIVRAPVVEVPPIDLSEIVTAVNNLKPGVDAEEIADAIVRTLQFPEPHSEVGPELAAVAKSLEKLDFRLQGIGTQAYGGGSVSLQANQSVTVPGIPNLTGTWDYNAGTSGTVAIGAGKRVIGIAAHSATGGTLTINGGATVTIPAGVGVSLEPRAQLVAPTLVFTTTDAYFVEHLT